jgi:hypothetical protein
MFTAWYGLVTNKIRPHREFVSVDATRAPPLKDLRSYEMLSSDRKSAAPTGTPLISVAPMAHTANGGRVTPDYFGREAKYHHPTHSFSSPKPPPGRQRSLTAPDGSRMDPLSMNKY